MSVPSHSEVDDGLAERRLRLSSWLHTAFAGQQNLLEDLQHRRGFIHRLDVPTSGLLLVATSYAAYYDMQLQLMARRMTRQYLVLCHGWLGMLGARRKIEARIHSLEAGRESHQKKNRKRQATKPFFFSRTDPAGIGPAGFPASADGRPRPFSNRSPMQRWMRKLSP